MKKIFTLLALAMVCIVAKAEGDVVYHKPCVGYLGGWETVLGPDMISQTWSYKDADGAVKENQWGVDVVNYPWISYVNETNGNVEGGSGLVQASNRWTDLNPTTGEKGAFIQATGANGSVNSPVISKRWGKYLVFNVANTTKFVVYATGSSSNKAEDLNALVVTATPADGGEAVTVQTTPGTIWGKGNGSDCVSVELDPAKSYSIKVESLLELGLSTEKDCDIQVTGINLVSADPMPVFHTPAIAEGDFWETVLGPDMITTKTKDGAEKPGIDTENYPWISYVNPTSTLDDGTAEVQQSNRWTDINPTTGEKGEWIQATGKNGSVNSPVITKKWGKYLQFFVKDACGIDVYATGSSSNKAEDNNCLVVTATPIHGGDAIVAKSTPGAIYGKGSGSDVVPVALNPACSYIVTVESELEVGPVSEKDCDIQVTGINLKTKESVLQSDLALKIKNAADSAVVELLAGHTYELKSVADAGLKCLTIKGNGAKVVVAEGAQLTTQLDLTVENVNFDCAAATVAPVAMSAVADSAVVYSKVLNEAGELVFKYDGANQDVLFGGNVTLKNCNFSDLKTSLFAGGALKWAVNSLVIDGCVAQFNYADGDPTINMYGGANSIKDIVVKNSTLYNIVESNKVYFLRYSNVSNAQPQKVWGTEGKATWVMENNTLVNLCSNNNFANNYVSKKDNCTISWKKNVFYNCWRLQKAVGNCAVDFTAEDNWIKNVTNSINGSDATYATEMADLTFAVPETALDFAKIADLKNCFTVAEKIGDLRWWVAPLVAATEGAKYFWGSNAQGVVTEVGGKAAATEEAAERLNYSNSGYYTICLNGKNNWSDNKYITVTLDEALKAGDVIKVTAYKTKGDASKKSGVLFRFNGTTAETAPTHPTGDVFNDIMLADENGENLKPNTVEVTVDEAWAGATSFDMTRCDGGTNLFITVLEVLPKDVATSIDNAAIVAPVFDGAIYNLAGQKVGADYKGIVIKNGKKYMVK